MPGSPSSESEARHARQEPSWGAPRMSSARASNLINGLCPSSVRRQMYKRVAVTLERAGGRERTDPCVRDAGVQRGVGIRGHWQRPASIRCAAVRLSRQAMASADAGGLPFAAVDKQAATLAIFRAAGQLVGTTPVLLGPALGDQAMPGVGARTQRRQLRSGDQVMTAGRFDSQPGHNLAGEAVVAPVRASAARRSGRTRDRRVKGSIS